MSAAYHISLPNNFIVKLSPLLSVLFERLISIHVISEPAGKNLSAFLRGDITDLMCNFCQNAVGDLEQADQKCLRSFVHVELVKRFSYEKFAYLGISGRKTCKA